MQTRRLFPPTDDAMKPEYLSLMGGEMWTKKPDIEAICKDCGQKHAEGCVPKLLDDTPYCAECGSYDLKLLPPREDYPSARVELL